MNRFHIYNIKKTEIETKVAPKSLGYGVTAYILCHVISQPFFESLDFCELEMIAKIFKNYCKNIQKQTLEMIF